MASESISIPILTPGADTAARNIKKVGDAAAETGGKVDFAAGSLAAFDEAARKSAKADTTLVQARQAHTKGDKLLADAENVLAGKATTTTKLFADQGRKLDDLGKAAGDTAGGFSALAGTGGGGGAAGGGMAAIIGISGALLPVIATIGTGVGGLALAAAGAGKNSKQLGQDLAPLKAQVSAFQHTLQPTVLSDFAKAAQVAGHVLHDIEPVTQATGKALAGVLGQVDATFQSGTWQSFFAFMQKTAGPDIRLLGQNFTDLLQALPPLAEDLQPVSQDLLYISDATAKLVGHLAAYNQHVDQTSQHENALAHTTDLLRQALFAPGAGLLAALKLLHITGGDAGKGLVATGAGAVKAQQPVWNLDKAVATLNTDMGTLVGNVLTLQGDNVTWRQSMEAAKKQLDSNKAGLEGNSKAVLQNKQAIIQSTNSAITFAGQQLTLGKDIVGASGTIQKQINWLQSLHDKSKFVRQEIEALRKEEALLQQQRVNQIIHVDASGRWGVVQGASGRLFSGKPLATGGRVPGHGSGDTVPAMLTPGEAVVPKRLVGAVAPFLGANKVPGFAAGGIVPSYSGAVGGVWPWIKGNDQATINLIDQAVVKATLAGIRAASSGFGRGRPLSGAGVYSQPQLESLWIAAGGPPTLAHLMAAIADAESGGKANAYNASGASGLWQILGQIIPGNIFNPYVNAENAVAKYRSQGLGAWVTYTSGAYKQYFDRGGLLMPGTTVAVNNTGRPEMVVPAGGAGSGTVNYHITVNVAPGTHPAEVGRQLAEYLNEAARRGTRLRRSILSANG